MQESATFLRVRLNDKTGLGLQAGRGAKRRIWMGLGPPPTGRSKKNVFQNEWVSEHLRQNVTITCNCFELYV